jgi:hypothetical protein
VHRYLKPLNLLVNSAGDLKVDDYGIARSLRESATARSSNARSSGVSLAYAGPQQLLGEPAAVTDDIYTLGTTLFELLTGKPPFHEGDLFSQVCNVVPPKMAFRRKELGIAGRGTIPAAWEETVAACLAKNAADRPQSAAEVAARLGISLPGLVPNRRGKNPSTWIWAGVGAVAAFALVAAYWPRHSPPADVLPATKAAGTSPRALPVAPAREFLLTIIPPDTDARIWLGPRSDLSVPPDGRVSLSGIPDGDHDLIVQAAGYQPNKTRVTIRDGRGRARVELTAVYGAAEISARPGTTVTAVDTRGGRHPVGTVPPGGVLRVAQTLTVGTYDFLLTHPDCGDIRQAQIPLTVGRVARIVPPQV